MNVISGKPPASEVVPVFQHEYLTAYQTLRAYFSDSRALRFPRANEFNSQVLPKNNMLIGLAGFEPATCPLSGECSTAELQSKNES